MKRATIGIKSKTGRAIAVALAAPAYGPNVPTIAAARPAPVTMLIARLSLTPISFGRFPPQPLMSMSKCRS